MIQKDWEYGKVDGSDAGKKKVRDGRLVLAGGRKEEVKEGMSEYGSIE
jgi:hypothetical protein